MTTRPGAPRAVLFDFAGTLFAPQHAARQLALAAADIAVTLAPEELDGMAAQFLDAGMPGGPYPESVPEELRSSYRQRDLSPASHRDAYVSLMATVPAPAGLAAAVYERVRTADAWVPYRDANAVLRGLAERGIPVGLVSNVGFDVRPILKGHGMEQLAVHAALSFEQQAVKPSPELYLHALADLHAAPEHTLMVGDHPIADGGARALGMQTLIVPMCPPGSRNGIDRVLELVDAGRAAYAEPPSGG